MNPWTVIIVGILKSLTISVDVLVNHIRLKDSFVLDLAGALRFIVIGVTYLFVIMALLYSKYCFNSTFYFYICVVLRDKVTGSGVINTGLLDG